MGGGVAPVARLNAAIMRAGVVDVPRLNKGRRGRGGGAQVAKSAARALARPTKAGANWHRRSPEVWSALAPAGCWLTSPR